MAANSDDEQLLAPVAPMSPTKQPRRASMDVDNNNEPRRGRSHSRSPRPSGSGSIDRRDDDRRNDNARPDDRARSGSARGGSQSHVRDQPEPSKVLGVFGMSLNTRQRDLEEIFGKFGALEKCVLVMDRFQERSRGFGFVTFERQEDAR